MKKELITAYAKDKDMTFILEESYNGNELATTECIRWHYGEPLEEDTTDNSRDLVARHSNHGIEVYYTGGGIWIAQKDFGDGNIVNMDNDMWVLTCFEVDDDTDKYDYMYFENMIWSHSYQELEEIGIPFGLELFDELATALEEASGETRDLTEC